MNKQERLLDYAHRGLAEFNRRRDEYYARREEQRRRPFQPDEGQAWRGGVSPLGGQAKPAARRR
jgi:hypothetical protein